MKKVLAVFQVLIIVIIFPLFVFVNEVNAATFTSTNVSLSDSRPSATSVTYTIDMSGVPANTIKCFMVYITTSYGGYGGSPTGLNMSGVTLNNSSTFIASPASWNVTPFSNYIMAIYNTGNTQVNGTLVLDGVTNGSAAGVYYASVETYPDRFCTSPIDFGYGLFAYTDGVVVNATVEPTLTFSLSNVGSSQTVNSATTNVATSSATAVTFGSVTAVTNKIAAHDLIVGTNAVTGYTIYVKYTGALTSGGNTITDHTGTNASPTTFVSPGTEGFGYTTEDGTLGTGTTGRFTATGGNKWAAYTTAFTTSNEVAYSASAVASETTRVGYQVSVSATTEPGTYTTTVVYSAVPKY